MTPLKDFCSSADAILVNIADAVTGKVSEMLINLKNLETYIITLLETNPAKIYPIVASNLNHYRQNLVDKELEIKAKLQELLPAVKARTNGKSEKDLIKLIQDYNLSPFNNIKSRIFLDSRSLEIKALNLLMKDLDSSKQENFEIADYKNPNKASLFLKYRKVVEFSVNILQPESVTKAFLSGNSTKSTFWYNDNAKASALGEQKTLFENFIAANRFREIGYLISINKRNETVPITMHAIKGGKRIGNGDFIIPDFPKKLRLVNRADNQITIEFDNPNNRWVTNFYVEYWRLIDGAKQNKSIEFQLSDNSINNATISALKPLTIYQLRVILKTEFGVSPSSEMQVTTTPCSEPKNIRLGTVTENSLEILWSIPVCGVGIKVDKYKVTLKGM